MKARKILWDIPVVSGRIHLRYSLSAQGLPLGPLIFNKKTKFGKYAQVVANHELRSGPLSRESARGICCLMKDGNRIWTCFCFAGILTNSGSPVAAQRPRRQRPEPMRPRAGVRPRACHHFWGAAFTASDEARKARIRTPESGAACQFRLIRSCGPFREIAGPASQHRAYSGVLLRRARACLLSPGLDTRSLAPARPRRLGYVPRSEQF